MNRIDSLLVYGREVGVFKTSIRVLNYLFTQLLLVVGQLVPFCWPWACRFIFKKQSGDAASVGMFNQFIKLAPGLHGKVMVPSYLKPVFVRLLPLFKNKNIEFVGYSDAQPETDYTLIILQIGFLGPLFQLISQKQRHWKSIYENPNFFMVQSQSEAQSTNLQVFLDQFLNQTETKILGPLETQFYIRPHTIDRDVIGECYSDYIQWLEPRISGRIQAVDIGGHIGGFSVLLSKLVSNESMIETYEPFSKNFEFIKQNMSLNQLDNISPFQMAVSDRPGHAELHLSEDNTGGHRLHIPESNSKTSERVEVTTLKNIFDHFKNPVIDILKVDVEGSEQAILMAEPDLLKRVRFLICEAGGSIHGDALTVLKFLEKNNFSCEHQGNSSLMIIRAINLGLVEN